jgi:hypothetical protein
MPEGGTAMNAFLMAVARLARGQFYVFQPMAKRYRSIKIVKCPETEEAAEILLDEYPSAIAKAKGQPSIRNCSLWPRRRGCTQSCLGEVKKQ